MVKKNDIHTPEGYFDSLEQRLLSIPSSQGAARRNIPGIRTLAPYLSMAASMILAVVLGNFILRKTAAPSEEQDEWAYLSYLATALDPDGLWEEPAQSLLSQEDIVQFLISEQISVEQLNAYYDEETY